MKSAGNFEFAYIPPTFAAARITTVGLFNLNHSNTDSVSSKFSSLFDGLIILPSFFFYP